MNWMLIRASGLIAYVLLSASVIWGLVLAGRLVKRSPKSLNYLHESLSVGALVATVAHVLFLSVDRFVEFDWDELLVPGRSDWHPIAVAFGIVALYGMFLVSLSFYLRKQIGQRFWRGLHYSSFGIWAATVVHGLLAGTDRFEPWVLGLYASTAAAVLMLIGLRYRNLGFAHSSRSVPARDGGRRRPGSIEDALERSEERRHDRSVV